MIAKPEDLDYQLAYDAHRGTSHVPEDRAVNEQAGYAEAVNRVYAELSAIAETDTQRAILDDEIQRFRAGYLSRKIRLLSAKGRCVTSMIAGPSGHKHNARAYGSVESRTAELVDWSAEAKAAIARKLADARTPEQVDGDDWTAVKRNLLFSLREIESIDSGRTCYDRSSYVNSITTRVKTLARNGRGELVRRSLEVIEQYNASHHKPAISPRSRIWSLAEQAVSA